MKRIVALVAAGMFVVSFAAQADEGSCYGNINTASTPKPVTVVLETVSQPVQPPKTGS